MSLLPFLKNNPKTRFLYEEHVTRKRLRLNQQLIDLREEYKTASEEEKLRLKENAEIIKTELENL